MAYAAHSAAAGKKFVGGAHCESAKQDVGKPMEARECLYMGESYVGHSICSPFYLFFCDDVKF